MSDPNKFGWADAFKLSCAAAVIGVVIYFMGYWTEQENKRDCVGKYSTPGCFERKAKEARAKEEYEKKLKEIRNG